MVNPTPLSHTGADPLKTPRRSMTALAARSGEALGHTWSWELRSVNGKGRDLRLRLPDWLPALEAKVRTLIVSRIARGNVTCALRIAAAPEEGGTDANRIAAALEAIAQVQAAAERHGVKLSPPSPAEVLSLRSPAPESAPSVETLASLQDRLMADLEQVLEAFEAMRAAEGAALEQILRGQLDGIADLVQRAQEAAQARAPEAEAAFRAALARVAGQLGDVDPDRVAQEIAVLAVKADVTEELDRLRAHIGAARDLLAAPDAVGRKLDFLCQEFNREANTLCAKSQSAPLTAVGLDLKALIDQFREQVQNLE